MFQQASFSLNKKFTTLLFSLSSFSLSKKFTTLLFFCVSLGVSTSAYGQATQYTEGKADQTLKGSGRINAATNAMEFSLPLGSYPGRGINVPVSLSYSSKLWHVDYASSEVTPLSGSCYSLNYASFADRSASGWTTSVGVPYIEYMDKPYDVLGNVYRDDVDIACNPRGGGTQFNPSM